MGFTNFSGPSPILAAQAASFNKGQDVQKTLSNEDTEKNRQLRQTLFKAQKSQEQKQTNTAERGFLA